MFIRIWHHKNLKAESKSMIFLLVRNLESNKAAPLFVRSLAGYLKKRFLPHLTLKKCIQWCSLMVDSVIENNIFELHQLCSDEARFIG